MIIQENNPFTGPSFNLSNRVRRQLWNMVWLLLFRPSPRPMHAWRSLLLRLFGARIGKHVHIYPSVRVWAPWNLMVGSFVGVGDGANIYCMDRIEIGEYSVVSQGAYLCAGSHDYNSQNFQLITSPIVIGRSVWLCTDSFIGLGVDIAEGSVVGARSVVTKSIKEPWCVWAGMPVKRIGVRNRLKE